VENAHPDGFLNRKPKRAGAATLRQLITAMVISTSPDVVVTPTPSR